MASSSPRPRSDAACRRRWARSESNSTIPTDNLPRSIFARAASYARAMIGTAIETLFRRDDAVVLAALFVLALLALLVAVEKLAPFGAVLTRAMGAMLMVGGAALLAAAP